MKKIISLLLALVMTLSLSAAAFAEEEQADAPELPDYLTELDLPEVTTVEDGELILATNCHFPPYEMVADTGTGFYTYDGVEYAGIDIEMAWYIAQTLGLELVIYDVEFDSSLIRVQEGTSDILLAGLTYTEERDEVMDFSTSYAQAVQVVIVPEDSDIESPDDLAGDKMIGTQRGTTGFIYCTDDYGEEHVIGYDNGALAVQALQNGQVDAVVIDNAPAQEYVNANAGLKILDTEYTTEDYCIAVSSGNEQLLGPVNTILETMIDNGLVDEIVAKYIHADESEAE